MCKNTDNLPGEDTLLDTNLAQRRRFSRPLPPTLPGQDEIVALADVTPLNDDPLPRHQMVGAEAGQASLNAERQGTEGRVELQVHHDPVDVVRRALFWRGSQDSCRASCHFHSGSESSLKYDRRRVVKGVYFPLN